MSQLREQLRKIIPRMGSEANKLRDPEARSRWMKLKQITLSTKSLSKACAFYGWSEDSYSKWGLRLRKKPRIESLFSKSQKPHRSPSKTKPQKVKKVVQIRRADPSLGPERISDELQRYFNMKVPPSTIYSILKREQLVAKKYAEKLTKKHLKRYRRPFPGFLQMDFKYVPYKIEGNQYYQLSCVDHHSSWRYIRIFRDKSVRSVMTFLRGLIEVVPFPIMEIQTDNDTAFTDNFSSLRGVTGAHEMDIWCQRHEIHHRLIPVGQKELNGKVENTHKQDDREFFAKGPYRNFESLSLNSRGYNERWNASRRTKALGFKSPEEVLLEAYIKTTALLLYVQHQGNTGLHRLNERGDLYLPIPVQDPKKIEKVNIKTTKKKTYVEKYLQYLEWESKRKNRALALFPLISQNFPDGLEITELIADRGYGSVENLVKLSDKNIATNIPLWSSRTGISYFDDLDSGFKVGDVTKDEVYCPQGHRMTYDGSKSNNYKYKLKREIYAACPFFENCLTPTDKNRNQGRRFFIPMSKKLIEVREQSQKPEFIAKMRERMWKMEGIFAEAKSHHGLKRARYRGRAKVQIQVYMISIVQNLKRLVTAAIGPPKSYLLSLIHSIENRLFLMNFAKN